MKKIARLLSVCFLIFYFFSGCTIEKRKYRPGYNIQWNNTKQNHNRKEVVRNNIPGEVLNIPATKLSITTASITDEIAVPLADNVRVIEYYINKKSTNHDNELPEDCDLIILKNGDEIKAKVSEISGVEIKYTKCEETNGPTYTLKKSSVFMVKYPNGTKDLISQEVSVEAKNKSNEKEDNGILGILSFVFMLMAVFLSVVTNGVAFLVLGPIAIVMAVVGLGRKRKFKGFALATLIGMSSLLLLLLLYALSYS